MKSRTCIIILTVLLALSLIFTGCENNKAAESHAPAEDLTSEAADNYTENAESRGEIISDSISSNNSREENSETAAEASEEESEAESHGDVIEIAYENGKYMIFGDGTGSYITTFTMENGKILFSDGRSIPFIYSDPVIANEENGEYRTIINGRNYSFYEYTDPEGTLTQILECIDEIEGYSHTSSVVYRPESGSGEISLGFVYQAEGDVYTLTYPDGYTEKLTVSYDEETDKYTILS